MKRIEQLKPLSMEHHLSLVLANQAVKTAKASDGNAINALCEQIVIEFETRWEQHFQKEEHSIFAVLDKNYQAQMNENDKALNALLLTQHNQMRDMAKNLKKGNAADLTKFGELLKEHTRLEERQLFPLITDMFSRQELDAVLQQEKTAVTNLADL